jgi:hypothetical protein
MSQQQIIDIRDFIIKNVVIKPRGAKHLGCIYCGSSLEKAKKEHLFNASWGGRESTSALVCTTCNEFFSSEIDDAFKDWVRQIRNAWGIKTQRNPKIPHIISEDGITMGNFGRPQLHVAPSIKATLFEDGSVKVEIAGWTSKRHRKEMLTNFEEIERQIGRPLTENQRRTLESGDEIKERPQATHITELKISATSYPEKEFRNVGNVLIKCIGYYMPEIVRSEALKKLRDFVRYGNEDYRKYAVVTAEDPNISPALKPLMMSQFNCAEIYFCKKQRMIVGVVNVMGHIKRSIIMQKMYP